MSIAMEYRGPALAAATGDWRATFFEGQAFIANPGATDWAVSVVAGVAYDGTETLVTLRSAVLTEAFTAAQVGRNPAGDVQAHAGRHKAGGLDPLSHADLAGVAAGTMTHAQLDAYLAGLSEVVSDIDADLAAEAAALAAHKTATPAHTAAQVGLGNVTNDAQVKRTELGAPGGTPTLNVDALVVQDPASASTTPGPGAIPKADLSSLLDAWISTASTAVAGKVQLATTAEAQAGTDTSKAITPAARRQAALSEMRDMLGVFPGIIRPTLNLHAGLVSNDDCPLGTFTRSAPKWRLGPTGLVETVVADKVAREWDTYGRLLGWLLEGQRTCLIMHNTNLLAGVWLQFSSPTVTGGHPDIFGGATAVSIGKPSTADVLVRQGVTMEADALPVSAKFYVKRLYGGQYTLAMYDTDTYANAFGVLYDANSQTVLTTYGSLLSCKVDDGPAGHKVVEFTFNNINKASWVADIWSHTQSAPDIFSAVQVERGAFSTSLIKTADSPVTRPADVWTIPTSAFAFNPLEGTMYVSCDSMGVDPASFSTIASLTNGVNYNDYMLMRYVGSNIQAEAMAGAVVQSGMSNTASNPIKTAFSWKKDSFLFTSNGLDPVADNSGNIPAVTRLDVGCLLNGFALNGHLLHLSHFARHYESSVMKLITA